MFVILIGSKWSEASEFALVKIKRRSVVNDRVNIEFRIHSNHCWASIIRTIIEFRLHSKNDYYIEKLYTVHVRLNFLKSSYILLNLFYLFPVYDIHTSNNLRN